MIKRLTHPLPSNLDNGWSCINRLRANVRSSGAKKEAVSILFGRAMKLKIPQKTV